MVTVPIAVSIWILGLIIGFMDGLVRSTLSILPSHYSFENWTIFKIPGLGLITTLLFLILIGALARNIVGRRAMGLTEKVIDRIPLMRSVYGAVKQLLTTLFVANTGNFKRVVLIEYPRPGIWALAFVTNEDIGKLKEYLDQPCCSLFVPTTPNPTSGYYVIAPNKDTIPLDIDVETAFKMLISAGIVSGNAAGGQQSEPERIAEQTANTE